MVNGCGSAFLRIHACGQLITEGYRAFNEHTFVQVILTFFGRIFHLEDNTIRLQETSISSLTTTFCVERRLVENQDGFIASVAALAAVRINPSVADWLIYGHRSAESGHADVLADLNARPLLDLDMRLGEGSGAMMAVSVIQNALNLHADMATFAEAGLA